MLSENIPWARSGQTTFSIIGFNLLWRVHFNGVKQWQTYLSLNPDIVLLNLYLKYGAFVWDVLRGIKGQDPGLPGIIITHYDNYLYNPELDQADDYFINSRLAPVELKPKITALLNREHAL